MGDGIAIAVGAALGSRINGTDKVSLTFFGDGATGTGGFHEAVNLAAVLKLPVIFMCENNHYAVSTHVHYSSPVPRAADRAAAYGIPSFSVDGNDVLAVYEAVKIAVASARNDEGPQFIEGLTYRWEGHYKGDPEIYRSKAEVDQWREERDPLLLYRVVLQDKGVASTEDLDKIDEEVNMAIEEAIEFAENSPIPPLESLFDNLYVEDR